MLAWTSVALTVATILMVRVVVAQPHPGRLGMEGTEGTPLAYVGVLAFSIVGALIVSSHPRHLVGWIFCLCGLAAGVSSVTTAYAELGAAVPGSLPALDFINAVSGVTFLMGFFLPTSIGLLLFPDGRLLSRRWRFAVYGAVGGPVLQFVGVLVGDRTTIGYVLETAGIAAIVLAALAAAGSLLLRWRHASGDVRQQLKWVGVASAVVFLVLVTVVIVVAFRPALIEEAFLYFSLAYACVPVSVGIAILRYRLYDIDLLINRAIVYVSLTGVLAGLYAGSTALVQRVFVALTGQRSDAAIVVSAFLLATIFTPARNQLQAFVDKRFKDPRDLWRLMEALEHDVESVVGILSGRRLAQRLLDDAREGTGAIGGALYLDAEAPNRPTLICGSWDGISALSVPLRTGVDKLGQLALGPRRGGAEFGTRERERLQKAADIVTVALAMSTTPSMEAGSSGGSAAK
jgi:hypothetical protein